jgi:hypothetical protein
MEKLKHILIEAKTKCPAATQDIELNATILHPAYRRRRG